VEYKKFKEILKNNKITVKKFSELANISYNTCNAWSKRGEVSGWVESWLTIYERNQLLENIQDNKENDCEEYKKALAKALMENMTTKK